MKKILIQPANPFVAKNTLFNPDRNNQNQVWRELKRRLALLGYEALTADDNALDDCAWIFFLDVMSVDGVRRGAGVGGFIRRFLKKIRKTPGSIEWPNRALYKEAVARGMEDKLVLFLWEGSTVSPDNYRPALWKKFKLIFTWRDDVVDNKKFFKFYLPAPLWPAPPKPLPFKEKKLLVNISSNKWYRGTGQELFSARAKTSRYFDSHYPDDFDLFGTRWQRATTRLQRLFPRLMYTFTCYRGTAPDKMETISKYKFALCYENVADDKGLVTEKLFDILQAGSVPIYWGAPNILDYVDAEAFVDRRKFKSDAALAEYLRGMTEEEYENMRRAGEAYLRSERCQKFFPAYFCDRIIEVLKLQKQ